MDWLTTEVVVKASTSFALVVIAALAWRYVRPRVEQSLARKRTKSFGQIFSKLLFGALWAFAILAVLGVVFPSFNVATFLGGLGLLGVAAGFAFQDILSNLLAGILLIFRQPFVSGDQIEVNGVKGTVEVITIRETHVRTFDGRLVYVPNADVYKNAIEVQTDRPWVRTSLVVGVDYDTDLDQARDLALQVLRDCDLVSKDTEPQALYTEFGASSINLDLRYWTRSRQADIRTAQDAVVRGIKKAFDDAGINIPFDIVTLEAGASLRETVERRDGASANGQARTRAEEHAQN